MIQATSTENKEKIYLYHAHKMQKNRHLPVSLNKFHSLSSNWSQTTQLTTEHLLSTCDLGKVTSCQNKEKMYLYYAHKIQDKIDIYLFPWTNSSDFQIDLMLGLILKQSQFSLMILQTLLISWTWHSHEKSLEII